MKPIEIAESLREQLQEILERFGCDAKLHVEEQEDGRYKIYTDDVNMKPRVFKRLRIEGYAKNSYAEIGRTFVGATLRWKWEHFIDLIGGSNGEHFFRAEFLLDEHSLRLRYVTF